MQENFHPPESTRIVRPNTLTKPLPLIGLCWVILVLACGGIPRQATPPRYLPTEERDAIHAALRMKRLPQPVSLEITDSGWLVATFELRTIPEDGFRVFGENALLAIREAMLPSKTVEKYRVTLNGPSPGTGMIRRYGSARYIEGGRVEWEEGVR